MWLSALAEREARGTLVVVTAMFRRSVLCLLPLVVAVVAVRQGSAPALTVAVAAAAAAVSVRQKSVAPACPVKVPQVGPVTLRSAPVVRVVVVVVPMRSVLTRRALALVVAVGRGLSSTFGVMVRRLPVAAAVVPVATAVGPQAVQAAAVVALLHSPLLQ
jgi:hypothetical protein